MERNNQRLVDALYRFMKRDYSQDVRELNRALAETETADLRSEAPPIPFTGDPWSKVKHECTLLVGINPKWHEPGSKTGQYETEIANSIEDALKKLAQKDPASVIMVCGSIYFLGEFLNLNS